MNCKHFLFGIRMSRLSRILVIVLLFCTVFGIWLKGSLIVIQIDSEELLKYKRLESRNEQIRSNIDSYCRKLAKQDLLSKAHGNIRGLINSKNNNNHLKMLKLNESRQILERAHREKLIRDNLIYFPELKQMWCLVPKGGSTSWSKAIVNRLNSYHVTSFEDLRSNYSLQVQLRHNYGNINKSMFTESVRDNKVKKVLLVRHPFSRIVSAYQDKLMSRKSKPDGIHFYQKYGVRIVRKFRANRKANKKKEPTFEEFVNYLINSQPIDDYDDHWKPISLLCGLCHIRYDHIIFLEELETSVDFHLKKLGFPQGYSLPRENSYHVQENKNQMSSADLLFRNISNSQKIQLLKIFQDDFRLFGYSFLKHYV